jgi:proteasome accessory factor C
MSQSVGRAPRRQQNPRPQATDVVARMLSVVPFLIDNSPISVTEASSRFGVSENEMRSIVRTLFVTGVPGDSGKGLHGDLFDFDYDSFEDDDIIEMTNHVGPAETPRFSGREAAALIAGLQYMSDVVRDEERSSVDALISKIRRGATGSPENISVRRAPLPDRAVPLAGAISENLQVEFSYLNAEGSLEERRVCPIRLDVVGNTWYLRGFCHLRDSMRTFRTDRMRNVLVLSEARDHAIDPASLPDTLFDAPSVDSGIVVTVEISESAVSLLSDYDATVSEPTGGVVRAELTVAHLVNLRKLVALAPGVVRVVSPDFAVAEVARWATSGASWHKNDPLTRA